MWLIGLLISCNFLLTLGSVFYSLNVCMDGWMDIFITFIGIWMKLFGDEWMDADIGTFITGRILLSCSRILKFSHTKVAD